MQHGYLEWLILQCNNKCAIFGNSKDIVVLVKALITYIDNGIVTLKRFVISRHCMNIKPTKAQLYKIKQRD